MNGCGAGDARYSPDALVLSLPPPLFVSRQRAAAAGYCSMRLQIMELVLLFFWVEKGESFGPGRPADPEVASMYMGKSHGSSY
jgi:hypothetical protein